MKKGLKILIILFPFLLLVIILIYRSGFLNYYHSSQPVEVIGDMDNQKKPMPQSKSIYFNDSTSFRIPPKNSKPRNISIYKYEQIEYEQAEEI